MKREKTCHEIDYTLWQHHLNRTRLKELFGLFAFNISASHIKGCLSIILAGPNNKISSILSFFFFFKLCCIKYPMIVPWFSHRLNIKMLRVAHFSILSIFLLLSCWNVSGSPTGLASSRITSGVNVASGEFPFVVAITVDGSFSCSGFIYNSRWIVTVASCMTRTYVNMKSYNVTFLLLPN